jgi:hypothetical protein
LPYGLRQESHRALADGHYVGAASGHRSAKIATRSEIGGIRLVQRTPELGGQRGNLDRNPFAEGAHSGVDIIAKRAVEYVPPNETAMPGFLS